MIFLGKDNLHTLPFFTVIAPKRRHTSGPDSIRPKNGLCTLDGGWGCRGGKSAFWSKTPPPTLLGPSVGFCGASTNFPFHSPRRGGGRTGGEPWGRGGRLAFNPFLVLTKWPFSAKMILSKRSTIHDIK